MLQCFRKIVAPKIGLALSKKQMQILSWSYLSFTIAQTNLTMSLCMHYIIGQSSLPNAQKIKHFAF